MKYIEVESGYELQIGDIVKAETVFGENWYDITRVTKKYAFAKISDTYEMKYPRVYVDFTFGSYPKQVWKRTTYRVYKPVL